MGTRTLDMQELASNDERELGFRVAKGLREENVPDPAREFRWKAIVRTTCESAVGIRALGAWTSDVYALILGFYLEAHCR